MQPVHQIASPGFDLAALNVFDVILLLILLLSTAFAFQRGFIRALLSLGGVIVGFVVASWNYLELGVRLHRYVTNETVSLVAAFFLIFIGIVVLFSFFASLLRKAVKGIGLGFLDRLLGAAFGVIRGVLIGVALMMVAAVFAPDASWLRNSTLAPYFLAGAHAVSFVVPKQFAFEVTKGATRALHETPELMRPHTLNQPDSGN